MIRRALWMGAAAGAVGTAALNITTYLDMVVRGRPTSSVPAEAAAGLAEQVGVDLSPDDEDPEVAQNRKEGLGALLGYVTGVGVGTVYGLVRTRVPGLPRPAAALGVGLAAMAGSDVPIVAMGLTDPREWGAAGWASDLVPHLAYGFATAFAYDAFTAS